MWIVNKHMKECSASLVIGEMQIKATMRCHLTPVRVAIIKKSTDSECWRGCGEGEALLHRWWECKLMQPLWRTVWRFLKGLEMELPYNPVVLLLGICPEKTIVQRQSCTTMFIAALFAVARTWKQPGCPVTDVGMEKMWHIYTMEYYSAIKRSETELFVVRWMDLESVIQSEVSRKERDQYHMLTHVYGIKKKKCS